MIITFGKDQKTEVSLSVGSETGKKLIFDYYYGRESEQFTFYRIPKLLIKHEAFKGLSSDSKLLYGLMLDRMSLSRMNGWYDKDNRVYIIYTVQDIMEDLGCGNQKAAKLVKELTSIGLITKKRRGLGQADLTYVMNFITATEDITGRFEKKKEEKQIEVPVTESTLETGPDNPVSPVLHINILPSDSSHGLRCENHTSENVKNAYSENVETTRKEVPKSHANYNESNNTDLNKINPSSKDAIDGYGGDMTELINKKIRENLNLDHYERYGNVSEYEFMNDCFLIISEIVSIRRRTVRIGGNDYPYDLVRSRFMEVTDEHVLYVKECMDRTAPDIRDIRSYLMTALFNAPATINTYYSQQVRHDFGPSGTDYDSYVRNSVNGSF